MERNPRGRPRHPDVLTPAEWRVLEELREGGTNAEIAARLGISGDAVKYHISNMLGKLELRGRDELAAWRPERRRGRLGAVFAVPAAFEPLVRSLAWVGAGTAAAAGLAAAVVAGVGVVFVVLVAVGGNGNLPEVVDVPAAERRQRAPSVSPLTPLPAATSAPTPTPSPPPTPEPTATARPARAQPTLTATPAPTSTATPAPTSTATPAPTPTATAEPTPTATAEPTPPLDPQPTPPPDPQPTPPPDPQPTPAATPTPELELTPDQRIAFIGEVEDERKSFVREELARVMAFYADRYDVVVPEFTLYFSTELAPLAEHYRELHDSEAPIAAGFSGGWVTSVRDATPEAFVAARHRGHVVDVLAHEYYHLLQHHLLLLFADGPRSAPGWIVEGTARYGETLYHARESAGDAEFLWRWEPLARAETPFTSVVRNEAPFKELALGGAVRADLEPHHYTLAASGVAWLVANSGNDRADLDYWRLLAEMGDAESAFAAAFGITVDSFVEAFEAYRAGLSADLPEISGVVVDLDGQPLAGVHISASPISASPRLDGGLTEAVTPADGTFAFPVLPGFEYLLRLGRVVGGSPDRPFTSIYFGPALDPATGHVNRCGSLSFVPAGAEGVANLVVHVLPALLRKQEEPVCNEGLPGFVLLSGIVVGPESEAITEGITICAEHGSQDLELGCVRTQMDGSFTFAVPDGTVSLRLFREHSPGVGSFSPIGWYGEGGLVRWMNRRTAIEVEGSDIGGIEIHLPAELSDLPFVN